MQIPDEIAERAFTLKDQYFDLKGLSVYSSLGISTIREYIRRGSLPAFKLRGKLLIKRSAFDRWMKQFEYSRGQDLNAIVDSVMKEFKRG